jgi:hypothetical protein
VKPVGGSAKLLFESRSHSLNRGADERLVLKVVASAISEGFQRVQDFFAGTTRLVRRVKGGEPT